ncbi:MAG TPA: hypothetical protein VF834_23450, partial [Streptosporangiaceae bacterium]
AGAGLTVRLNERFTGGWTVRRFAGHGRVDAIQVELNQRRYLDIEHRVYPAPPEPGDFEATQCMLRHALRAVTAAALGRPAHREENEQRNGPGSEQREGSQPGG